MALGFHYKQIRDILKAIEEAFTALEKRINSPQHQAQVRTYLNSMNIENIKKEKNCSNLQALETAHSRISDTVPNCGKDYQQESHYCDFLERVVQRQPWAHQVIQNRPTPSTNDLMDYNKFYSKLVAALTSWETLNQNNYKEHIVSSTRMTYQVLYFFARGMQPSTYRVTGNFHDMMASPNNENPTSPP